MMTAKRWRTAPDLTIAVSALAAIGCPAAFAVDLATTAILQPVSGCALTSTESVTVRLFNYGPAIASGSAFDVSYTINAGPPATEMVVLGANLLADSQLDYTFVTQANLSPPGTYVFDATVSLPGDTNPANNAYSSYVVTNDAVSNGGVLSGPATPGSSGTLVLSSPVGNVVRWEESDDGGSRWYALANTTTTQDFAGLRVATKFRARVQNGSCPEAISNGVTVVP